MEIEEAYVSYDIAKRLKEVGFNESIGMLIQPDGRKYFPTSRLQHITISNSAINIYKTDVTCPTQQMAMRWLREAKGIFIKIDIDGSGYYNFNIYLNGSLYSTGEEMYFETYELAVAFGLLFVLTKMEL